MAFSATEAAFEGFRVARRNPGALVVWAGVYVVTYLIMVALLFLIMGSTLMDMSQLGTDPDPTRMMANMAKMQSMNLITMPWALIVTAVFTAAVYRAVLRPTETGFGFLRLGPDEWRLVLLNIVLWVLYMVAMFVLVLGCFLVFGGLAFALGAGSNPTGAATIILAILGGLTFLCVLVWVSVRMSLAAPMTFAQGKLKVFESWSATKGHFWPLFGSYLLAGIMGMLAFFVVFIIIGVVMAVVAGGTGMLAAGAGTFSPTMALPMIIAGLFALVLVALAAALFYAVALAPSAVAYRELVARDANEVSVFS
jgi:hypothetical protein